jgi:hypothetical protein
LPLKNHGEKSDFSLAARCAFSVTKAQRATYSGPDYN